MRAPVSWPPLHCHGASAPLTSQWSVWGLHSFLGGPDGTAADGGEPPRDNPACAAHSVAPSRTLGPVSTGNSEKEEGGHDAVTEAGEKEGASAGDLRSAAAAARGACSRPRRGARRGPQGAANVPSPRRVTEGVPAAQVEGLNIRKSTAPAI